MERLTDEQLSETEYKAGYLGGLEFDLDDSNEVDVRRLFIELRYYKQLSEKRGKALEKIKEIAANSTAINREYTIFKLCREALQEDTP